MGINIDFSKINLTTPLFNAAEAQKVFQFGSDASSMQRGIARLLGVYVEHSRELCVLFTKRELAIVHHLCTRWEYLCRFMDGVVWRKKFPRLVPVDMDLFRRVLSDVDNGVLQQDCGGSSYELIATHTETRMVFTRFCGIVLPYRSASAREVESITSFFEELLEVAAVVGRNSSKTKSINSPMVPAVAA